MYTAFTKEIDDPEAAARDILDQLNLKENQLKNSFGIILFYKEFVETEAFQAVANALPFDVAGCASPTICASGDYSDLALSLTMFTSDDIEFSMRAVENTEGETFEEIDGKMDAMVAEFSAKKAPDLVMAFLPFPTASPNYCGEDFTEKINALPKPFPVFGTVAFTGEADIESNLVSHNSKLATDMFVFIAFYGKVSPTFRVATSFTDDESFGDFAKITDADGLILKTVNDIPVAEYLRAQGILNSDNAVARSAVWTVPAILSYPDGTKLVRAFFGVVDGTEHIIAGGRLEVGASIRFALLDEQKTLKSAEQLITDVSDANHGEVLAFSCAARSWALGPRSFDEMKVIVKHAEEHERKSGKPLKYSAAYCGGEVCPVVKADGTLKNAFHNYTLISCAFN